VFNLMQLGL